MPGQYKLVAVNNYFHSSTVMYAVHVCCSLHTVRARCFLHVWNNTHVRHTCALFWKRTSLATEVPSDSFDL